MTRDFSNGQSCEGRNRKKLRAFAAAARSRRKHCSAMQVLQDSLLEALRRVGSLEVFRGAGGGLGTGRKDCTGRKRTAWPEVARITWSPTAAASTCQEGLQALRRVGSLEVVREAGGGLGAGRKDCTEYKRTAWPKVARIAWSPTAAALTAWPEVAGRGCRRCGGSGLWRFLGGQAAVSEPEEKTVRSAKGRHGQRLPASPGAQQQLP